MKLFVLDFLASHVEGGVYGPRSDVSEVFSRNASSLLGRVNLNLAPQLLCGLARIRVTFTVLVSGGDEFNGWKQTRTRASALK